MDAHSPTKKKKVLFWILIHSRIAINLLIDLDRSIPTHTPSGNQAYQSEIFDMRVLKGPYSINGGFSIATFDDQRVLGFDPFPLVIPGISTPPAADLLENPAPHSRHRPNIGVPLRGHGPPQMPQRDWADPVGISSTPKLGF